MVISVFFNVLGLSLGAGLIIDSVSVRDGLIIAPTVISGSNPNPLPSGVNIIVSTGRTDKWVISGLLSIWIRTAERHCRLCIHIPLYPLPNSNPEPNPNPKSYPNLKLFNE